MMRWLTLSILGNTFFGPCVHTFMFPGRRSVRRVSARKVATYDVMYDFVDNTEEALEYWERIDDGVMGGISTSSLRESTDKGAVWSGIIREDGGGFCGTRTARLESAMDLSQYSGLWIKGCLSSDADINKRAWKCTIRCQQNAGELVYTSSWTPDGNRCEIPFSSFRLARGPRLVNNAPPLSTESLKNVYGIGLTVSKFANAALSQNNITSKFVDNFRPGFFRVDLIAIGVYGNLFPARSALSFPLPNPDLLNPSKPNSANSNNLILKALSPLSTFVFSQDAKRRALARRLILKRKHSKQLLYPRRYGQTVIKRGIKRMSLFAATTQGLSQLTADIVRTVLAIPLRLTFRLIFALSRLRRRLSFAK